MLQGICKLEHVFIAGFIKHSATRNHTHTYIFELIERKCHSRVIQEETSVATLTERFSVL